MPGMGALENIFKGQDFKLADLKLGAVLQEYGKIADDIWLKAPVAAQMYWKMGKDTWNTYTGTYVKRFQDLPSDDQRRFMHSGLDRAIVFLLLTMISRMILTKCLEPYFLQHFLHVHGHGFSFSFNQAKWIFSASLLFVIWHANSHAFFDSGVLMDLSLMLGTAGALAYIVYRQSSSVKTCFAFFVIPALVLFPVSISVAIMQHGPYLTQPKMFPALLAVVTALTAVYFIFEAPPTPVVKAGHVMPFGTALRHELENIWYGNLRRSITSAPGRLADSIVHGPTNLGKKAVHAGSTALRKSGARVQDFVVNQEESGRQVIRAAGPVVQSMARSVYQFFEGLFLFMLGLICRLNKFFYYLYRSVIDVVTVGLQGISGLEKHFAGQQKENQHGRSASSSPRDISRDRSEERSPSRSKTPTGSQGAPRFSRRVSRQRSGEEGEEHSAPPRERRGRRNY